MAKIKLASGAGDQGDSTVGTEGNGTVPVAGNPADSPAGTDSTGIAPGGPGEGAAGGGDTVADSTGTVFDSSSIDGTGGGGNQSNRTEIVWIRTVFGEDPVHGLCLAAAGIALGVVLTAIGMAIARWLRRRKESSGDKGIALSVEKLHEQGARKNQQDCFAVSPLEFQNRQGVLAMVADGMGGLSDGDKVSQAAVSAALDGFFTAAGTPEQILLDLLSHAAAAVERTLGPGGMRTGGTTMVMGLIKDGAFHCLSVGDSRICLYRDGVLYQLNREHIFRNELAVQFVNGDAALQEMWEHPKAGGLTSYLGMGDIRYVDLPAQPVAVRPGDRFILMCDGVYNALDERELAAALDAEKGGVAEALRAAIQAKNYANQDNYTAVILEC